MTSPTTADGKLLRAAAAHFPTGVAIVTTMDANADPVGCTVSSFLSVSLDPAIVAVSLRTGSQTASHIAAHGHFGINVLAARQHALAHLFASPEVDYRTRFAGTRWRTGHHNVPLIDTGLATMACTVREAVSAGDHVLFLGNVDDVFSQGWGGPLIHHQGSLGALRAV